MTARPARIVDAHVHLWDPARTDWYPYLSGRQDLDMGDISPMSRRFDTPTFVTEALGWNVVKFVNVAAATGWFSIEETLELDQRAVTDGQPTALIGGLPPTDSVTEAIAALDRQMAAARFRGARPMGASEGPVPAPEVLAALRERDLVLEVMVHSDRLRETADRLEVEDGDLVVVIEHAGWPRDGSAAERSLWQQGIDALAGLGDNVVCKLSGLAGPLGSMTPEVLAPWLEYAIDAFGVERCLFASNFPVDGNHGTLDELYSAYSQVTAGLGGAAREKLFAANAERVYRI